MQLLLSTQMQQSSISFDWILPNNNSRITRHQKYPTSGHHLFHCTRTPCAQQWVFHNVHHFLLHYSTVSWPWVDKVALVWPEAHSNIMRSLRTLTFSSMLSIFLLVDQFDAIKKSEKSVEKQGLDQCKKELWQQVHLKITYMIPILDYAKDGLNPLTVGILQILFTWNMLTNKIPSYCISAMYEEKGILNP